MILIALALLADQNADLSLACTGTASTMAATGLDQATMVDNQGYSATTTGQHAEPVTVRLSIRFEMTGGSARIFLPAEMRPQITSTKDGWYPVRNLAVSERRITGNVRLNFVRTTAFEIDRSTGAFTTKHGFAAMCDPVDTSNRWF